MRLPSLVLRRLSAERLSDKLAANLMTNAIASVATAKPGDR